MPDRNDRALHDIFSAAFRAVREIPGAPNDEALLASAINGMISGFGEDTSLVVRAAAGQDRSQASVGLAITKANDRIVVAYPLAGSPGALAGVRSSDELVFIDGHPIAGLTLEATANLLKGAEGSEAALVLRREGQTVSLFVIRRLFKTGAIATDRVDGVSYVRIDSIDPGTAQMVRDWWRNSPPGQQGDVVGLILDLRGNAGGLWDEVQTLAGLFLPPGDPIADVHTRRPRDDQHLVARGGDITHALPMVVLVNGATGSGAEVVAAALQANHRAAVMGRHTLGQGGVVTVYPLMRLGLLHLQTGRITLANGKPLDGLGIIPDIELPGKPGVGIPSVGAGPGSAGNNCHPGNDTSPPNGPATTQT